MKRFKLTVAYDGTAYSGFQVQKSCPTIEGELNKSLTALLGEEIHVIGASRTDAGVHALCNVAVFDSETTIPAEKLAYALNQRLPEDIRIQKSEEVADDFHPRHCDSTKTYEYRITVGEFPIPTKRLYSHFTYHKLDVTKMQEAAKHLIGEHDFNSFCAAAAVVETTVRTVYDVTVEAQGDDIVIRVSGNGFLYNMVRIIVGTLVEVGLGKIEPNEIPKIIEEGKREKAGKTLQPNGLYLVKVEY